MLDSMDQNGKVAYAIYRNTFLNENTRKLTDFRLNAFLLGFIAGKSSLFK